MREPYWSNKKRVLEMVERDGMNLGKAYLELRDDEEVVLTAIKRNSRALQYASERLQDNEKIVLITIQRDYSALQYASKRLQDDEEIVLVAIRQDEDAIFPALQYASKRLQDNEKIVKTSIQNDWSTLAYASERLQDNKDIVMVAVKESPGAIAWTSKRLQEDKDVFLAWVDSLFNCEDLDLDNVYGILERNHLRLYNRKLIDTLMFSVKGNSSRKESLPYFKAAPPKMISKVLKDKEAALKFIEWNPMCVHWLSKEMLEDTDIMAAVAEALTGQKKWVVNSVGGIFDKMK